jgi:hypothetical protein
VETLQGLICELVHDSLYACQGELDPCLVEELVHGQVVAPFLRAGRKLQPVLLDDPGVVDEAALRARDLADTMCKPQARP